MLPDYHPDDLDVRIAELLVATADDADQHVHPKVQEVLRLLRERLGMDVVFVSEFVDGERVFRFVDQSQGVPAPAPGDADPLEESWCVRVADGRLPGFAKDMKPVVESGAAPKLQMDVGTFLSTPIRAKSGAVFGTLCCYSHQVSDQATAKDLQRLQFSAQMLAEQIQPAAK